MDAPDELVRSIPVKFDLEKQVQAAARLAERWAELRASEGAYLVSGFPNVGKFVSFTGGNTALLLASCVSFPVSIDGLPVGDARSARFANTGPPQLHAQGELEMSTPPTGSGPIDRAIHDGLVRAARAADDSALGTLSGGPVFVCAEDGLFLLGTMKEAHWHGTGGHFGVIATMVGDAASILV
jgi:hypothetical protein